MRHYLGSLNFKWSYTSEQGRPDGEQLFIERYLGEGLYQEIEEKNYTLVTIKSRGPIVDAGFFCTCDVYVDIEDENEAAQFVKKYYKGKHPLLKKWLEEDKLERRINDQL